MPEQKKGIYVSKATIFLAIMCGFCVLATVGLVAGFTRRVCPSPVATPPPQSSSPQPSASTTSTSPVTGTTTAPVDMDKYRLPGNVIPVNYNLDMKVYFDPIVVNEDTKGEERFEGRAVITVRVLNATSRIVFHCDTSLRILEDSVRLTNKANGQTTVIRSNQHYYDENQFYKIDLDAPLAVGEYDLQMDYRGDYGVPTNLVGFYKTTYREDGVIK